MNCQDFENLVLALARNQLLEATTREQSLAHAEFCVSCAARLAEERALMASVRLVVAELAKQEAPARVEMALLTALRAQAGHQAPIIKPLPLPGRRRSWNVAVAWAAVLLVALIIGVAWLKLSSGAERQDVRQSPVPPISPALQRDVVASDVTGNVVEQKRMREVPRAQSWKVRRGVRPVPARTNEVASPFYLLVEEGELAPLESGRVVRVEVPASTLITWGLPITAENSNQPVQADLLLGQDGLARAIRFLP